MYVGGCSPGWDLPAWLPLYGAFHNFLPSRAGGRGATHRGIAAGAVSSVVCYCRLLYKLMRSAMCLVGPGGSVWCDVTLQVLGNLTVLCSPCVCSGGVMIYIDRVEVVNVLDADYGE